MRPAGAGYRRVPNRATTLWAAALRLLFLEQWDGPGGGHSSSGSSWGRVQKNTQFSEGDGTGQRVFRSISSVSLALVCASKQAIHLAAYTLSLEE